MLDRNGRNDFRTDDMDIYMLKLGLDRRQRGLVPVFRDNFGWNPCNAGWTTLGFVNTLLVKDGGNIDPRWPPVWCFWTRIDYRLGDGMKAGCFGDIGSRVCV